MRRPRADSLAAPGKHFVGHRDRLFSKEQAADKIKAAVDARTDPDFVIIARSDAIGVTSLDDALDRANAYAEAGADLLLLPYLRLQDTRRAVDALAKPLFNVVIDTLAVGFADCPGLRGLAGGEGG